MIRRITSVLMLGMFAFYANAKPQVIPQYDSTQYDRKISRIYAHLLNRSQDTLPVRIAKVSHYFLGRPYLLGALGEGENGKFDKNPLYRTDTFDCMTYVETILALAEAKNPDEFKEIIKKIRYQNGQVDFVNRNHFTSVDWNPNNERQGFIHDITHEFNVPYTTLSITIDKPNWYKKMTDNRLKLFQPLSSNETTVLLNELKANASQVKITKGKIDYLPLSDLFSEKDNEPIPNEKLFAQIPSGSIIETVRPHWDLRKKIGTYLDVEHMGFAIRTSKGLMFREASSYYGQVVDVPLEEYLAYYYLQEKPTVAGIHIEEAKQPLSRPGIKVEVLH